MLNDKPGKFVIHQIEYFDRVYKKWYPVNGSWHQFVPQEVLNQRRPGLSDTDCPAWISEFTASGDCWQQLGIFGSFSATNTRTALNNLAGYATTASFRIQTRTVEQSLAISAIINPPTEAVNLPDTVDERAWHLPKLGETVGKYAARLEKEFAGIRDEQPTSIPQAVMSVFAPGIIMGMTYFEYGSDAWRSIDREALYPSIWWYEEEEGARIVVDFNAADIDALYCVERMQHAAKRFFKIEELAQTGSK